MAIDIGQKDELVVRITKPYKANDSLAFIIRKEAQQILNIKRGEPWHLKVDLKRRRLIYEPVRIRM